MRLDNDGLNRDAARGGRYQAYDRQIETARLVCPTRRNIHLGIGKAGLSAGDLALAYHIVRCHGHRPRVFCASLADWLDNQVPKQWRFDLGQLIEDTPELDWLLLTKRPENYKKLAPWDLDKIPSNVWLGVTCEDQPHYERRWAILSRARIKAAVKFVSYEPALGPLTKLQLEPGGNVPDWIICGGESGTGARRMKPAWVRAVRDECAELDIAFFMKQIGDNHDRWPTNIRGKGHDMDAWPKDLRVRQFPPGQGAY